MQGRWLLPRKSTVMWSMVHTNHEWRWLEKVKAYAKPAATEQLAWGNTTVCLEVFEEEWEVNQYKKENPQIGKPVGGQASSTGGTEESLWSGITGCISGCNSLITSKEKMLCRRSMNYRFQLLMAVIGSFSSSRPEQGKTWVISPEACHLRQDDFHWDPQSKVFWLPRFHRQNFLHSCTNCFRWNKTYCITIILS